MGQFTQRIHGDGGVYMRVDVLLDPVDHGFAMRVAGRQLATGLLGI
jgi:hypothetical protein